MGRSSIAGSKRQTLWNFETLTWKSTETTFTLRCSVTRQPRYMLWIHKQLHESSRAPCVPLFDFRVEGRLVRDPICATKTYGFTGCSFWHGRWRQLSCPLWPGYATTCRIRTRTCLANNYCSVTYRTTPVFYYLLSSGDKQCHYLYTYRHYVWWPHSPCVFSDDDTSTPTKLVLHFRRTLWERLPAGIDRCATFQIDKIEDTPSRHGITEDLVKWKGWDSLYNSWLPRSYIQQRYGNPPKSVLCHTVQ